MGKKNSVRMENIQDTQNIIQVKHICIIHHILLGYACYRQMLVHGFRKWYTKNVYS